MPDGIGEQRQLSAVEAVGVLEQALDVADLGDLSLQVSSCRHGLLDHLQLVDQEVGGVAVVGLGLQEGTRVLGGRVAE